MKRFVLGLAVVGLALALAQPCLAQPFWKKLNIGDPMRWVKADGSGSTTIDSTTVAIPWTDDLGGDDQDTTASFDLTAKQWPFAYSSTDSSTSSLVLAAVVHWSSEATGDTMRVGIQYSIDGTAWSSGKWVNIVGLSNQGVDTWRRGNGGQVNGASLDQPIRYVRWIVKHTDQSTKTVRTFTLRPYYWTVAP